MSESYKLIKVFCDGGSRGNPGPSAAGTVFLDANDEVIASFNKYLGETTNNVAEYSAVILALQKLADFSAEKIEFYLDSELVVKQLKGIYRVKQDHLKPLHKKIIQLADGQDISFSHVLRAYNKLADEQVNICLDSIKS